MITVLRRAIKGKAAKTLLIVTAAAVGGVFTLPLIFDRTSTGPWIAKVNGRSVSYNDFVRKAMENESRIREFRAQYGQLAEMLMQSMGMSLDPRLLAANQLIREELMDQLANRLDLHLDDEYMAEMLANRTFLLRELADLVPPSLIDPQAGLNMDGLKSYLARIGLSVPDFEQKVEEKLRRSLAVNLTLGSAYVPNSVVRARYIQEHSPRRFSVLVFDFNTFLDEAKKDSISKEQLKQYFDAQNSLTKRYWVPEKRSGRVWSFDHKSYGINVQDDEIQTYYDDNKQRKFVEAPVKLEVRHILIKATNPSEQEAAYQEARSLHAQLIKDPASFEAKAREVSADKESAQEGGLLPAFSRGEHDRSFEKAAFLLKNDGDISDVVRTAQGFEIVQRVGRTPAVVKSFSSVKAEVKNELAVRKFKDQFYKDMRSFLNDGAADDAERSRIIGLAKTTREVEPQEKSETKMGRALFRSKEGELSFYVDGDQGFVVELTKIQKRYLPTLEATKDTVEGDFYEAQAAKALSRALEKAKREASGTSFAELKNRYKVKLDDIGMVKFSDAEAVKKLRQKGYPLDALLKLEKVGSVGESRGEVDGHLFKLEEIEAFNQEDFDEKKEDIRKGLQTEASDLAVESFVAFLHRNATIEVNKSIINLEE